MGFAREASAHCKRFATRQQAQTKLMDWLVFCKANRLHSTLGHVSPTEYKKTGWQRREKTLRNAISNKVWSNERKVSFLQCL